MNLNLNKEQTEAVSVAPEQNVLLNAGPGSGKTTVISKRIEHLLSLKIAPQKILALSFTNKSAYELKSRVSGNAEGVTCLNTHGLAIRIIEKALPIAGYDHMTVETPDEAKALLTTLAKKACLEDVKGAVKAINLYQKEGVNIHLGLNTDKVDDTDYLEVMKQYEDTLLTSQKMDFEMILTYAEYAISNAKPSLPWEYIFVDEAQDLTANQFAFLASLEKLTNARLFVVGDENQSIYEWMGASPKYMRTLVELAGPFQELALTKNYRSGKEIIETSRKTATKSMVNLPASVKTATVETREFANGYEEAPAVIQNILDEGEGKKIAILYRSNVLLPSIEKALQDSGLDYFIPVTETKKYDSQDIKDVIDALRLVFDKNSLDVIKVVEATSSTAASAIELLTNRIIDEKLDLWKGIATEDAKYLTISDENFFRLDMFRYKVTCFEEALVWNDKTTLEEDIKNYLHTLGLEITDEVITLVTSLCQADTKVNKKEELRTLLANIENDRKAVAALDVSEGKNLTVMSIHQSKGLEFDRVYVVGVENGIMPADINDKNEVEQAKKLLFVAETRAREYLWISWANKRFIYGNVVDTGKSVLL